MKLNKIVLNNFRQYYGKNEIIFSGEEKNITLILGINNAGKTSIFRGLIYGLYGERTLGQDSKAGDIHLVNLKAIEEKNIATATVEVELETYEGIYIVKRSLKGAKVREKINDQKDDILEIDFKDINGEYHKNYKTDKEAQEKINSILDENIKEFFIFDGEKIETLARADNKSRKEVKDGIIKLMQIDELDSANKLVNRAHREFKKHLTDKSASNNLKVVEKEVEELNKHLFGLEELIEMKEKNIENLDDEIAGNEKSLKENRDLMNLFNHRESLDNEKKTLDKLFNKLNEDLLENFFRESHSLVLSDYYMKIEKKLSGKLLKQGDLIPIQVIEKTLNNKRCLCCNQDVNNDNSIEFLEKIKSDYKLSKSTRFMENMSRECKNKLEKEVEYKDRLNKLLLEIYETEDEISEKENQLETINQKISDNSNREENIKELDRIFKKNISERESDKLQLKNLIEEKKDTEDRIKNKQKEYEVLIKEVKGIEFEYKRLEFISNFKRKLDEIYKNYINVIRERLGRESTETFKSLIDYKDKSLVDDIVISENYEIDIRYKDLTNITQDISQGQQMIVALSFITALAKLASKGNKVDFPLFMDTPFARLSKKNRKNLIVNLPNLTRQWIPLLTDTELTSYEKDIFKKTNRVGKVYEIVKINEKESIIEDKTKEWEV